MLDDTARKLLRILFNLNRMHAAPLEVERLQLLAGRDISLIEATLHLLREERYIRWDQQAGIVQVMRLEEQPMAKYQHVFTD
ncbi:hypothetical protein ACFSTH_02595 [Paenibacillus yanchengensis]|uniref:Uncharacterized protein n=1 Tax=Paenibacillus yanchengensis TaxID=2035833 RepID=A0ABW4YH89_9BACL